MHKLRLDLEELQVDTFSTGADGADKGTVEAFRVRTVTDYPLSCWQSCWPDDTCPGCTQSCPDITCADGCGGTGGGGTRTTTGPLNTDPGGG
jgi:hypothetical protein